MLLRYEDVDLSALSKGMRQYMEIKRQYMDSILFFRLGDFYEMFFDDAITASKELELTLTSKDCGLEERPLCAEFLITRVTFISNGLSIKDTAWSYANSLRIPQPQRE